MSDLLWLTECDDCNGDGRVAPLMTASGVVVWMCNECDATWESPADVNVTRKLYPSHPDWSVREGVDVMPGTTRWARRDDLPQVWSELELHGADPD